MSFDNVASVSVKLYIHFWDMSKNEVIHLLRDTDLTEKKEH